MRKLLKVINLKSLLRVSRFLRIITSCLVTTLLALLIFTIFPEILAAPVDIEAGVNPVIDKLIKELNESPWSELMILFIGGSAVIGERSFTSSCVSAVLKNRKDKGREKMSP